MGNGMKIGEVMGPEKKKMCFFLYINQLIFQLRLSCYFKSEIFLKKSKHTDFNTLNLYLEFDSYFYQQFS